MKSLSNTMVYSWESVAWFVLIVASSGIHVLVHLAGEDAGILNLLPPTGTDCLNESGMKGELGRINQPLLVSENSIDLISHLIP